MRENNGGHRGRRRFRHDHETPRIVVPAQPCVICAQPISEMVNAVAYGADRGPAHFDCVLSELSKREALEPSEKIAYLGSGLFGVIVEKENNRFEIHRRILVDDPGDPPAWRKELRGMYKR